MPPFFSVISALPLSFPRKRGDPVLHTAHRAPLISLHGAHRYFWVHTTI